MTGTVKNVTTKTLEEGLNAIVANHKKQQLAN